MGGRDDGAQARQEATAAAAAVAAMPATRDFDAANAMGMHSGLVDAPGMLGEPGMKCFNTV